jgi:DNA-binding response OmpR family regulator
MSDKVLIVDDDLETLRLVGLMLQRQGFQIVAANNGTQAMGMARTEKPAIIVLDIMMPDIDGYEVTRQLRKDPDTANIPIILFTAKSQTEDKLTGYEAGADDYLTKPIHPAELVAKIKKLLEIGRSREATPNVHGYTIGVIAAKGGSCVSTVTLNLALAYHSKTKEETIAAELRPSQGTWALEMGFPNPEGLNNLLRAKPNELSVQRVQEQLTPTTRGIKLLMASYKPKDAELISSGLAFTEIVQRLSQIGSTVLLDIGTGFFPNIEKIASLCDEIILLIEPNPLSVNRSRLLLDMLMELSFGKSKFLTIVQCNRVGAAIQMTNPQMVDVLKQPIIHMIPPVPEQAFNAFSKSIPLIELQPNSLHNQQYEKLIDSIIEHKKK